MKIFLNATTLRKGGPLQRAVTFLLEVRKDSLQHTWYLAVSDRILAELRRLGTDDLDHLYVFNSSPSIHGASRRRLSQLEMSLQPDCIFTLAGPAYVKFRAPHLIGCTLCWVTHSTWRAYCTIAFPHRWATKTLESAYKAYWLRQADRWVVQTETARRGMHRRLRIPLPKIAVVPNTCGSVYLNQPQQPCPSGRRQKWAILCFAAPYPHKRLELVPEVAKRLFALEPSRQLEFILTLPPSDRIWRSIVRRARSLDVEGMMRNVGRVAVADGPALYRQCDICFLPTVLETFSATYPEAMAMNVPIVTTNLGFARDVCKDAALYFTPNDARSAAAQLHRLMLDEQLRQRLTARGEKVLEELPLPREQYCRYVQLLSELVLEKSPHESASCSS